MLDSDQVTFPSFAPSLSESPRQLKQSIRINSNYNAVNNRLQIHIPDNNFSYDD